ncbi:MAG: hypothetical protein US40_C0003G0002 [Candidatus Roizmanbacteria bacterium GW2011_GWC2_37_13]|uniref:Uncharacterized protein n=1 Tax=Candidatus Roizmanbacteria bacterium GW2011_GWC2_37_13 TaxID=1618486 RepID=A0A0G0GJ62_9BACT|nr:MAG: hypothetical protein US40_C0003G0002 [Candidatus Roizmanbacteria bacterium GW2011_GWC2_37_13]
MNLMKKVLLIILLGFVLFIIAGIIRTPEKVLPPPLVKKLTQSKTVCPSPFIFKMPVDLSRATSILYPGQDRGGEYKPHGGFRFDNSRPDEIKVIAPYDSEVTAGARYPVNGEIQYTFDFSHPCGIKYRFGHLLTLTPKFQKIAEKFPLPKGLDSRTTEVYPPIKVKQSEVIATAVGLTRGGPIELKGFNTFVDWGVYDYRQKNESSKNPVWADKHTYEIESYAVCWFDWISPKDRSTILSLPSSDYQSGKTSDYCK